VRRDTTTSRAGSGGCGVLRDAGRSEQGMNDNGIRLFYPFVGWEVPELFYNSWIGRPTWLHVSVLRRAAVLPLRKGRDLRARMDKRVE
jgi:hypothetical protein